MKRRGVAISVAVSPGLAAIAPNARADASAAARGTTAGRGHAGERGADAVVQPQLLTGLSALVSDAP